MKKILLTLSLLSLWCFVYSTEDKQKFEEEQKELSSAILEDAALGYLASCAALLDHGADCNARDKDGSTALMWAVKGGHKEIVKLLLDYDANIDIKNNDGLTALDLAKTAEIRALLNKYQEYCINRQLNKGTITAEIFSEWLEIQEQSSSSSSVSTTSSVTAVTSDSVSIAIASASSLSSSSNSKKSNVCKELNRCIIS